MVEDEVVALTLGHLSSAWLQHQLGRAEGFLLPKGVWYQGLFKEHPRALHPWAVPGGAVELLEAASWGHHGSPFPGPRLPKSLEPTSF